MICKGFGRKRSRPISRHYPGNYLKVLSKTTKHLALDIRCSGRDSNTVPSDYQVWNVAARQICPAFLRVLSATSRRRMGGRWRHFTNSYRRAFHVLRIRENLGSTLWPGSAILTEFSSFSSVSPGKCRESTPNLDKTASFQSFLIPVSMTLCNLELLKESII